MKIKPFTFFNAFEERIAIEDSFYGSACFILANGPSARNVAPSIFNKPGIVTFGINNGCNFWRPDMAMLADTPYRFHHSIWLDPKIQKFVPSRHIGAQCSTDKEVSLRVERCPNVVFYDQKDRMSNIWLWENQIARGASSTDRNSFVGMLHICYKLGFRRVYLWGCDFSMRNNDQYFFAGNYGEGHGKSNNRLYVRINEVLTNSKKHFEQSEMKVFNCTPDSALTAFEKYDMIKAIEREEIIPGDDVSGMYKHKQPLDDVGGSIETGNV